MSLIGAAASLAARASLLSARSMNIKLVGLSRRTGSQHGTIMPEMSMPSGACATQRFGDAGTSMHHRRATFRRTSLPDFPGNIARRARLNGQLVCSVLGTWCKARSAALVRHSYGGLARTAQSKIAGPHTSWNGRTKQLAMEDSGGRFVQGVRLVPGSVFPAWQEINVGPSSADRTSCIDPYATGGARTTVCGVSEWFARCFGFGAAA